MKTEIKTNMYAIITIVLFFHITVDLIKKIGEVIHTKQYVFEWHNALVIVIFLVAIFLLGKYSKIEIK